MYKRILQFIRSTTLLSALLFAFNLTPAAVYANGNNGTLKVHEIGTPSGTENNDPKVCAFNFEGFSFDTNQSGYIQIATQGGSSPVGQDAGPFAFGPTNNSGYAISQNFNVSGGTTIKNGTYKATLYGKDTNSILSDEKAKSKVFKVDCETATGSKGGGITPTVNGTTQLVSVSTPMGGRGARPASANELVNTGSSTLLNLIAGSFVIGMAAGTSILSRKSTARQLKNLS